jgi:hypothetical protein
MTTPHVTEIPRRLEAVEPDPFIDAPPGEPPAARLRGIFPPQVGRNAGAASVTERP